MRWRGGRRSGNIVDRRGSGSSGGGGGFGRMRIPGGFGSGLRLPRGRGGRAGGIGGIGAVILLLIAVFVFGLALIVSVTNAYLRDVSHLVGIGLNAWFYATPILYPLEIIPDWAQRLQRLNPMFHFVDAYRSAMYHLTFPDFSDWLAMALIAAVTLFVGRLTWRRLEPRLAEEL